MDAMDFYCWVNTCSCCTFVASFLSGDGVVDSVAWHNEAQKGEDSQCGKYAFHGRWAYGLTGTLYCSSLTFNHVLIEVPAGIQTAP